MAFSWSIVLEIVGQMTCFGISQAPGNVRVARGQGECLVKSSERHRKERLYLFGVNERLRGVAWIDSLAVGMIATDTLENFRQANRSVANLEACQESVESPDAESKRSIAAAILNALRASRTIRTNKTLE
jgi:hypothetical protein